MEHLISNLRKLPMPTRHTPHQYFPKYVASSVNKIFQQGNASILADLLGIFPLLKEDGPRSPPCWFALSQRATAWDSSSLFIRYTMCSQCWGSSCLLDYKSDVSAFAIAFKGVPFPFPFGFCWSWFSPQEWCREECIYHCFVGWMKSICNWDWEFLNNITKQSL